MGYLGLVHIGSKENHLGDKSETSIHLTSDNQLTKLCTTALSYVLMFVPLQIAHFPVPNILFLLSQILKYLLSSVPKAVSYFFHILTTQVKGRWFFDIYWKSHQLLTWVDIKWWYVELLPEAWSCHFHNQGTVECWTVWSALCRSLRQHQV